MLCFTNHYIEVKQLLDHTSYEIVIPYIVQLGNQKMYHFRLRINQEKEDFNLKV